jgi:hypothetical protein
MKSKRNHVVIIVEALIALPLVFLLWKLSVEFVNIYGFIVVPIGALAYLLIYLLVDKLYWRQSMALEQLLERKLAFFSKKSSPDNS